MSATSGLEVARQNNAEVTTTVRNSVIGLSQDETNDSDGEEDDRLLMVNMRQDFLQQKQVEGYTTKGIRRRGPKCSVPTVQPPQMAPEDLECAHCWMSHYLATTSKQVDMVDLEEKGHGKRT